MKFRFRIIESLLEAKQDIQAFVDKFGQDTYDLFIKSKDRLKNNKLSTDIVWHTKNTSPEEMDNILSTLQQKMGNKDMSNVDFSQKQVPGEYEYYGRMGDYDVYEPLDYISSMALGVNTGWCTTGRYGHYGDPNFKPSEGDAQRHFKEYTSKGIRLIYLLDPKTHYGEYAIAIYPERLYVDKRVSNKDSVFVIKTANFELFDARDDNIWDINVLPEQVVEECELEVDLETVCNFQNAKQINSKEVDYATLLSVAEALSFPPSIRRYDYFWWLRSSDCYKEVVPPGRYETVNVVSFVTNLGFVWDKQGFRVNDDMPGVRPALIVNPKSSNLNNGDIIKVFDHYWYFQDNLALLMYKPLIKMPFNKDESKGNDYETSDVKKWLDNWLKEQKEKFGGER